MSLAAFARGYRLSRAILAALGMLVAIGVMRWATSRPPTSVERATATVTEVLESSSVIAGDPGRIVHVRLDDGRAGRILVPRFVAVDGDRVPLILESYENGEVFLTFDLETWMDRESGS